MDSRYSLMEKAFSMFSDENNMMPVDSIVKSLRCAGFVVEDDFGSEISAKKISFEEFKSLAQDAEAGGLSRDKIEECFRFYDPKDTGYIKAYDFKRILAEGDDPFSESDIQAIFDQFPPNDDGMICYNLMIQYLFNE